MYFLIITASFFEVKKTFTGKENKRKPTLFICKIKTNYICIFMNLKLKYICHL